MMNRFKVHFIRRSGVETHICASPDIAQGMADRMGDVVYLRAIPLKTIRRKKIVVDE
jgi:hypothetical protein